MAIARLDAAKCLLGPSKNTRAAKTSIIDLCMAIDRRAVRTAQLLNQSVKHAFRVVGTGFDMQRSDQRTDCLIVVRVLGHLVNEREASSSIAGGQPQRNGVIECQRHSSEARMVACETPTWWSRWWLTRRIPISRVLRC